MKGTADYCKKISLLLCAVTAFSLHTSSVSAAKGLAADNAFENASFEQIMEIPAQGNGIGAICTTDDYIISIENTSDSTDPDVISAYYKNAVDEDGKEVEQYALAKQVNDHDYERPTGLAYNPKTNELIVSGYSSDGVTNKGSLFIIDADSLEYKKTIDVSQYNIIGAAYKEDTDQYIVQADTEGEYNYKLLDSEFNIVEELGEMNAVSEGTGYHGLYISNGYFINLPITSSLGIGDYIHIYSIAQKAQVSSSPIQLPVSSDITFKEPVAVFESAPGEFTVAASVTKNTGVKALQLFRTVSVPYEFEITTSGENGTVSDGSDSVARGEDFTLTLTPDSGYSLSSLFIDGKKTEIDADASEYIIKDVQSDHVVEAVFSKDGVAADDKKPKTSDKTSDSDSGSGSSRMIILLIALAAAAAAVGLYLTRVHRLRAEKRRQRKNEIYFQQREFLNDVDLDAPPIPDDFSADDDDIEIIEQIYGTDDEDETEELTEETDRPEENPNPADETVDIEETDSVHQNDTKTK